MPPWLPNCLTVMIRRVKLEGLDVEALSCLGSEKEGDTQTMKYTCENKHEFLHPAKKTVFTPPVFQLNQSTDATLKPVTSETIEISVCPQCQSIHYTESPELEPQVQNVYIYDLTSGPQTELDGLLAQGYRIVARYSKTYTLEKLKEAKT